MRNQVRISLLAIGIVLVAALGVPALTVGAASTRANAHAESLSADPGSQATEHRAAAQAKLTAAKLKACQNRQRAITNIMTRIADRGQKQLDLFTTIADRVQAFYTGKGNVLSNYDALVADVNTKQAAAQTVVDTIKSASTTFDCESTDPKGSVSTFKDSLKAEIAALQDYRTSVKDLTVGVKSAQGTVHSTANQTDDRSNQ